MVTVPTLQPFADAAPIYAAMGLRPFPVRADKTPAVKNWPKFGPNTYKTLLDRFASYNIGVTNDRDPLPITIVDIDDLAERDWCLARFGDTPVKVRSASGGEHWYYRANGQRRQLRVDGHKVDLLAAGGYGVLPPSHTPAGMYEFIQGDAEAFRDLPVLAANDPVQPTPEVRERQRAGDGRNTTLFNALRMRATRAVTYDDLVADGRRRNAEFAEPMSSTEVAKIAGSVWRYKAEGRLMIPGCESTFVFKDSLVEACLVCPDALALLAKIKKLHGNKGGAPFPLPQATGPRIMGWSVKRYRRARDHLIAIGELELISAGVEGWKRPTVVRLIDGAIRTTT